MPWPSPHPAVALLPSSHHHRYVYLPALWLSAAGWFWLAWSTHLLPACLPCVLCHLLQIAEWLEWNTTFYLIAKETPHGRLLLKHNAFT